HLPWYRSRRRPRCPALHRKVPPFYSAEQRFPLPLGRTFPPPSPWLKPTVLQGFSRFGLFPSILSVPSLCSFLCLFKGFWWFSVCRHASVGCLLTRSIVYTWKREEGPKLFENFFKMEKGYSTPFSC